MVQDDKALLLRLQRHHVEFVIIGGFCGIMHGVTLVTTDLDVCCPFTQSNLYRVQAALENSSPFHRLAANKLPLELTDDLCARLNNLYLQTDLGKLDLLSEVKGVGGYEDVLKNSIPFKLYDGEFRALSLDSLIVAKEAVGRERDLAAVRQLRAIKEKQSPP